jgi:hypothetical protein
MLDVIVCSLVFIIGINLKNRISGFNVYDKKILTWLFFWHIAIGIGFVFYISISGGDALGYWNAPKDGGWDIVISSVKNGSASGYVFLINYFPSKVLNLSFFTGSMLYVLLGYAGFVFLYKIIKENIPNYRLLEKVKVLSISLFPYFLFLPNLNFWTAGIGKDTILFFSIVIFIYALKNIQRRFGYIIVSIILSVFIRPHILLFLFLAYGLAIVFDVRVSISKKILLCIIFIGSFAVLLPYVMDFDNVENLDTDTITNYGNYKAGVLAGKRSTGSAIDITAYPYPLKVFTFLFRPLFFDMPTAFGITASMENFIFLVFFIKVFAKKPFSAFWRSPVVFKTLAFFFIIGSLIFPLILGNLGIIMRQKTPFIIAFIVFGYWSIINSYSLKSIKQQAYLENTPLYQ